MRSVEPEVFKIGELMRAEAPALFGDYTVTGEGTWVPGWRKV